MYCSRFGRSLLCIYFNDLIFIYSLPFHLFDMVALVFCSLYRSCSLDVWLGGVKRMLGVVSHQRSFWSLGACSVKTCSILLILILIHAICIISSWLAISVAKHVFERILWVDINWLDLSLDAELRSLLSHVILMALLGVQEVFGGWLPYRLKQWSPFWDVLLRILLDRTCFSRLHLLIGTIWAVTAVLARNRNWLNMQDRRAVFATICMIACLLCVAIIFDTIWHLIMVHITELIPIWWNICIHTSCIGIVSTHLVESRIIFHLICDKVAVWRVLLFIRWVVVCQYVLVTKLRSLIELILLIRIWDDHVIIRQPIFIWSDSLIIEHWSRLLEVVDWHH